MNDNALETEMMLIIRDASLNETTYNEYLRWQRHAAREIMRLLKETHRLSQETPDLSNLR